MSKGWVHWHPAGYGLTDDGALSAITSEWYLWHSAEIATVAAKDAAEGSWEKECEVITYEEAVRRLAQAVMKATAEELRKECEAAPKQITNPNMAPKVGIANPTEDRLMVAFRVDPSKYRVGVRKTKDGYEATVSDRSNGLTLHRKVHGNAAVAAHDAVLFSGAANSWATYSHPWKRADGSRIKASWEE